MFYTTFLGILYVKLLLLIFVSEKGFKSTNLTWLTQFPVKALELDHSNTRFVCFKTRIKFGLF